jgi:hypothetical protein
MLGFLTFIAGLISSYLAINIVYKKPSLPKTICGVTAVYFSFVILLGLYMDYFGVALSPQNFFIPFLIIAAAEYSFLKRKRIEPGIDVDRPYVLGFAGIVLAGFLYYVYPSLPSFFPLGNTEDPSRHFLLAQYIQESGSLSHGSVYYFTNIVAVYPFGMHLNAALLSAALNIELIKFIHTFLAFIAALSAAAVYGIAVESAPRSKTLALFSGFFVITSSYSLYQLSLMGSWAMLFAGFLAIVFVWFLIDYAREPKVDALLPLILLQTAIILTYPQWALVTLITLILVQIFEVGGMPKTRAMHTIYFVLACALLSAVFWKEKISLVGGRVIESGPFFADPLHIFGVVFIALAALGIWRRASLKNQVLLFFLISVCMQPILLFAYSLLTGTHVQEYWYHKTYYFIVYPLAFFAFLGLEKLVGYLHKMYISQTGENLKAFFLILLICSVGATIYVQIGKAEENRPKSLAITPAEYSVATWARYNVPPEEDITYIVNVEIGAASLEHITLREGPRSTLISLIDIRQGEILLVQNMGKVPVTRLDEFEVLYRVENVAVLRMK